MHMIEAATKDITTIIIIVSRMFKKLSRDLKDIFKNWTTRDVNYIVLRWEMHWRELTVEETLQKKR